MLLGSEQRDECGPMVDHEALSDIVNTFTIQLEVLQQRAWPGTAPSCRYRHASSRSGFLTRVCQAPLMLELTHLVTLLVRTRDVSEPGQKS